MRARNNNLDDRSRELLVLCDRVRDVDLFNLGVYQEDQATGPAIVRPVTQDIIGMHEREIERNLQRQREKEAREQKELEQREKGKLSPYEMFKMEEFSAWGPMRCGWLVWVVRHVHGLHDMKP